MNNCISSFFSFILLLNLSKFCLKIKQNIPLKRFSFIYITILLAALALKGCTVEEPAETDSKSSVVDSTSSSSTDNSTTGTASTQTFVDPGFCRLTTNTSSRNSSLIVNKKESNTRSSKKTGRVLYVDKSALSEYQTD